MASLPVPSNACELQIQMPHVCVVLPAAGVGERMSMSCPKQFCCVLGRPLISYTIESFERTPWILNVVIVVSQQYREHLQDILTKFAHHKVTLVDGASTRHRSIYNGVLSVGRVCSSVDVVVIHDAVRPFVDEETVRAVVMAAHDSGAAGVVRPLVSTVVATDLEGFLDHSLDRSKYRLSEMPQAFMFDVIKTAYEKCTDYDLDYGTECLHLAQRYAGVRVRLVDGPEHLWKVTYRRDLFAMEGMAKASARVFLVYKEKPESVTENLTSALARKLGDEMSFVSIGYDELNESTSDLHLANSIVVYHGSSCTANNVRSSTDHIVSRVHATSPLLGKLMVVHLIIAQSQSHCDTDVLTTMSSVRNSRGDGRVVTAVLTHNGQLSKAFDVVASLVVDRAESFDGQTFVF